MKKTKYNKQLMCSVVSLIYDFPGHYGHIFFPDCNCCDMAGCINMFEAIDPCVTQIITFSGSKPDTIYIKESATGQSRKNGEWKAYMSEISVIEDKET